MKRESEVWLELWERTVALYAAENPDQIAHTQAVVDYAARIAEMEGLPDRRRFLIRVAALLHDVGCPAARAKYGSSAAPHQETEGRRIVVEWLAGSTDFSPEEAAFLADVVGSHHHADAAKRLGFEPLFEADLIVNLLENYYDRSKAAFYRDRLVSTASGRRLLNLVFSLPNE